MNAPKTTIPASRKLPWKASRRRIRKRVLIPSLTLLLHLTPGDNQDWLEAGLRHRPDPGFQEMGPLTETLDFHEAILVDHIRESNPRLSPSETELIARTILRESLFLDIPDNLNIDGSPVNPVFLLASIVEVESSFDRFALSASDARGLMQIKPDTARWISYRMGLRDRSNQLFHTRPNLRIGMEYLRWLLHRTGDVRLAVLSYNAGPGSVERGRWDERYWQKTVKAYRRLIKREEGPGTGTLALIDH